MPTSKLLSPVTQSPVGCNYEPPFSPQRAPAALPCAAVRDLSASAYWDRLHWNFILWISPWNTDILTLKGNTENVAQCTERQKKARAAGLAGAKSPPSPAPRSQQWPKADTKSKGENKASVCCEFPAHYCFLHCLRYLRILNFFTQVELLQTCLGPTSVHLHLKWFIYPVYLYSYLYYFNPSNLLHFCLLSSNYKTVWIQDVSVKGSTVLCANWQQTVMYFFLLNDAPCDNKEGLVRDLLN